MFPETTLKLWIIFITDFKLTNLETLKINLGSKTTYCKLLFHYESSSQVSQLQTLLLYYAHSWLYYTLGGSVEGFLFKLSFYGNNLIQNCEGKMKKNIILI